MDGSSLLWDWAAESFAPQAMPSSPLPQADRHKDLPDLTNLTRGFRDFEGRSPPGS